MVPAIMAAFRLAATAYTVVNTVSGGALTGMLTGQLSKAQAPGLPPDLLTSSQYHRLKLAAMGSGKAKVYYQNVWTLLDKGEAMAYLKLEDHGSVAALARVYKSASSSNPAPDALTWMELNEPAAKAIGDWLST